VEPPVEAASVCTTHAAIIAQILRSEPAAMSAEEVREATNLRISFGLEDMTVVDWDAALVLDPEPDDVRTVLDFANVQLLEMRHLDQQLDEAIEQSYQLLSRRRGWRVIAPAPFRTDVRKVAELQLESAVLLERVTNALKVFGEEYLTRIYRLASRRFQLAELDASITRKLATVESIYQKMADKAAGVRMELLEWVVIILIALEIILSLAGH
jgi:flagellar motility protein MotE (MotC chaperone)